MTYAHWYFLASLAVLALLLLARALLTRLASGIDACDCDDDPNYDLNHLCIVCRRSISSDQREQGTLIPIR